MWRKCATTSVPSHRCGLMTPNGAVKRPSRKTEPVRRTPRKISDSTSGPAPGVPAMIGGVAVIVTSRGPAHIAEAGALSFRGDYAENNLLENSMNLRAVIPGNKETAAKSANAANWREILDKIGPEI